MDYQTAFLIVLGLLAVQTILAWRWRRAAEKWRIACEKAWRLALGEK